MTPKIFGAVVDVVADRDRKFTCDEDASFGYWTLAIFEAEFDSFALIASGSLVLKNMQATAELFRAATRSI